MKHNLIVTWGVIILTALSTFGATPIDTTHTWDSSDPEGWDHVVGVSTILAATNGHLELVHKAQSRPAFVVDRIQRPISSGALLSEIAFTLKATDVSPSRLRLQLHSARSGDVWQLVLSVPNPGESRAYAFSVSFSDGWSKGAYSTEERFLRDLRTIDWLGVEILRHASTGAQYYGLDDFRIKGVQFVGDVDMDYIADSWEFEHGLDTNDYADASLDADQDGMSNYAEFRAGSDPRDFGSRFVAKVATMGGETGVPFSLRWDSLADRSYTILRTTNLFEEFDRLISGVPGEAPTNEYSDITATNAAAYFYRIEVDPEF